MNKECKKCAVRIIIKDINECIKKLKNTLHKDWIKNEYILLHTDKLSEILDKIDIADKLS